MRTWPCYFQLNYFSAFAPQKPNNRRKKKSGGTATPLGPAELAPAKTTSQNDTLTKGGQRRNNKKSTAEGTTTTTPKNAKRPVQDESGASRGQAHSMILVELFNFRREATSTDDLRLYVFHKSNLQGFTKKDASFSKL